MHRSAYPRRACFLVIIGCLSLLLLLGFVLYAIIHAP